MSPSPSWKPSFQAFLHFSRTFSFVSLTPQALPSIPISCMGWSRIIWKESSDSNHSDTAGKKQINIPIKIADDFDYIFDFESQMVAEFFQNSYQKSDFIWFGLAVCSKFCRNSYWNSKASNQKNQMALDFFWNSPIIQLPSAPLTKSRPKKFKNNRKCSIQF